MKNLSEQRLASISRTHAHIPIDHQLGNIKETVFLQTQKAFVTLNGREGFGKTERILVSAKEAENNDLFHVVFPVTKDMQSAMFELLQVLSPKGSPLLSSDKWERSIAGLKKKVKKGYDPLEIGTQIATALNVNAPSFLLIDDLHHAIKASDNQLFFKTLSIIFQKSIPGVFILCTLDNSITIPQPYAELLSSIQTATFHLGAVSDEEAAIILGKHLDSQRLVDGFSSAFPFSSESIAYLNLVSQGNPLLILSSANVVLTAASFQQYNNITKEITEDSLRIISQQSWFEDMSSLVLDRPFTLTNNASRQEIGENIYHTQIGHNLKAESDFNKFDGEKNDFETSSISEIHRDVEKDNQPNQLTSEQEDIDNETEIWEPISNSEEVNVNASKHDSVSIRKSEKSSSKPEDIIEEEEQNVLAPESKMNMNQQRSLKREKESNLNQSQKSRQDSRKTSDLNSQGTQIDESYQYQPEV